MWWFGWKDLFHFCQHTCLLALGRVSGAISKYAVVVGYELCMLKRAVNSISNPVGNLLMSEQVIRYLCVAF